MLNSADPMEASEIAAQGDAEVRRVLWDTKVSKLVVGRAACRSTSGAKEATARWDTTPGQAPDQERHEEAMVRVCQEARPGNEAEASPVSQRAEVLVRLAAMQE